MDRMASRQQTTTSDSNRNTQMAGKQTLADAGGVLHRTRNALGDIGNRLTQKGLGGATLGKEKRSQAGKPRPAIGVLAKKTNFVVPTAHPSIIRGAKQRAVTRSNSSVTTTSTALGPKPINAKPLSRSQSIVVKDKKTGAGSSATLVRIQEGFIESKVEITIPYSSVDPTVKGNLNCKNDALTIIKKDVGHVIDVDSLSNALSHQRFETLTVIKGETVEDIDVDSLSSAFSHQRFEVEDIDAKDEGEFMLKEYVKDIADYLFKKEKHYKIREDFLKDRYVNSRMRAVLVDWLVEVHSQFGYSQETLFMAARILDRYLQHDTTVSRNQLQLTGVTALYIAAKFEEVFITTIVDFSSVSDNAFKPEDIRVMEGKMLKSLSFDLATPIPIFFLRRCSKACKADISVYVLAKYIMELSIVDYSLCHVYPSLLAASSLALSFMVLSVKPITLVWNSTLIHYSRYSLQDLKPVLKLLITAVSRLYEETPIRFQGVLNKYARTKFLRISKNPQLQVAQWKNRVLIETNRF